MTVVGICLGRQILLRGYLHRVLKQHQFTVADSFGTYDGHFLDRSSSRRLNLCLISVRLLHWNSSGSGTPVSGRGTRLYKHSPGGFLFCRCSEWTGFHGLTWIPVCAFHFPVDMNAISWGRPQHRPVFSVCGRLGLNSKNMFLPDGICVYIGD